MQFFLEQNRKLSIFKNELEFYPFNMFFGSFRNPIEDASKLLFSEIFFFGRRRFDKISKYCQI